MTLCEFFFPSTRSSRTRRDSPSHTRVTISPNHRASIHITSTPEHVLPGSYPPTHHSQTGSDTGRERSAEASDMDQHASASPISPGRRRRLSRRSNNSPSHESRGNLATAVPRRQGHHQGNLVGQQDANQSLGLSRSSRDAPRFSRHRQAVLEEETCFVGPASGPEAVDASQNFPDRSIRFRVLEPTDQDGADGEREMIVISSPGNMPWLVETLTPAGSNRHAVVLVRNPEGDILRGGLDLLARTLPHGWPFDIVVERE